MNELKELDELLMYALTLHRRPPLRPQEGTAWYRCLNERSCTWAIALSILAIVLDAQTVLFRQASFFVVVGNAAVTLMAVYEWRLWNRLRQQNKTN